jgi:hypothetical protein
MSKVYRVESHYGVDYFNTAKEADRHKPGGEEPEEVVRIDGAGERNRLDRPVGENKSRLYHIRHLLEELLAVCDPQTVANTHAGRMARKYIDDNPLPPADCAERDGGRSYGA